MKTYPLFNSAPRHEHYGGVQV